MSKNPKPVPVSELTLGGYLRWLASTMTDPATVSELKWRASNADDLVAVCDKVAEELDGDPHRKTLVAELDAVISRASRI